MFNVHLSYRNNSFKQTIKEQLDLYLFEINKLHLFLEAKYSNNLRSISIDRTLCTAFQIIVRMSIITNLFHLTKILIHILIF